jgi:hypothetical protein
MVIEVKEYLTLKDITAPVQAETSFGLKDILGSMKDLNELFKNARDLIATLRGQQDNVNEPVFHGRDISTSKTINKPPIHPSKQNDEMDFDMMVEKGIGMLELVKQTQGDIPVSAVIDALKQLQGVKTDGIENSQQMVTDMRIEGVGKDGAIKIPASPPEGPFDSRPVGGVQPEVVQGIPSLQCDRPETKGGHTSTRRRNGDSHRTSGKTTSKKRKTEVTTN